MVCQRLEKEPFHLTMDAFILGSILQPRFQKLEGFSCVPFCNSKARQGKGFPLSFERRNILSLSRYDFYPPAQRGCLVCPNGEQCLRILYLAQQSWILDIRLPRFEEFQGTRQITLADEICARRVIACTRSISFARC